MRRLLVGAGTLLMAYAVGGALLDPGVDVLGVVVFLAAVLVLHDAVLMPVVLAAGAATRRPATRYAGVVGAAVLVVGLPLALGFGRVPDDPSVLPLPYARNLLVILAGIAAAALLPRVVRRIRKGSESTRAGAARARRG